MMTEGDLSYRYITTTIVMMCCCLPNELPRPTLASRILPLFLHSSLLSGAQPAVEV